MHKDEGLDFSQVTTFNLDEYVGLTKDHPQSYHYFMHENLFKHINVPRAEHLHPLRARPTTTTPSAAGTSSGSSIAAASTCRSWASAPTATSPSTSPPVRSARARGSRPWPSRPSKTTPASSTAPKQVPIYAITMGVGTILEARKLILLASGKSKAQAIADAVEGPVTSMCTASALQLHRDATVIVDREAAGNLKMLDYYEWVQAKMPDAP